MKFNYTSEELNGIFRWKKSLKPIEDDINGTEFQFEYIFYPTGLGIIKKLEELMEKK